MAFDDNVDGLLIKLARDLEDESSKLTFISLGIKTASLEMFEVAKTLIDIKDRIQHLLLSEAESITFIYHSLKSLNCESKHLQSIGQCNLLIKDYSLRLHHPSVSYRILVLNILYDLSPEDYNDVQNVVKSVLDIRKDDLEKKEALAYDLVCEGVMLDFTDSEPIRALSNNSCRSRKLINEFYEDPHIIAIKNVSKNDVEKKNQFITKLKECRSRRKTEGRVRKCRLSLEIFILMCFLGFFIGGVATTVAKAMYRNTSNGTVRINDYNIIPVNDEGFGNDLDSVHLTLSAAKDDGPVAIDVYRDDCKATNRTLITLNESRLPLLYSPYFKRQPYNYNQLDTPLYGLKGSTIQFNVTARIQTPFTLFDVDLYCYRIRIFTKPELYQDAIDPGEHYTLHVPGTVDESPCISIGSSESPSTSNWTYTFTSSQYVYATIDVGKNVEIMGSITGRISRYQLCSNCLMPPCSPLTSDSPHCRIKICGDTCGKPTVNPLQCIYVQLQQQVHNGSDQVQGAAVGVGSEYEIQYTSELPIYKFPFFISTGITVLVLVAMLSVSIYLWCRYCRPSSCTVHRPVIACNRQNSNDSGQHLLN